MIHMGFILEEIVTSLSHGKIYNYEASCLLIFIRTRIISRSLLVSPYYYSMKIIILIIV